MIQRLAIANRLPTMIMAGFAVIFALPLTLDGTSAVFAQGKSGQSHGNQGQVKQESGQAPKNDTDIVETAVESIIDSSSRALMEDYFHRHPQPVASLPPGIAKNLQRGKPLPPGIAKRGLPPTLSADLRNRGSSVGDIVDAVIVGDDVAIVDAASGVVVEILKDIVRAR